MKRTIRYYRLILLRHDLPAGLSVFFVALPLCLGIALASDAPLSSGIMGGIIGGIVVSLISGSALAVSGPAAGLTVVVASAIASLGSFETFLLSVIIAGLFQVVLSLLKLGSIANYFPSAVIKGMLSAIGIMLIVKQLPVAIGFDQPSFWTSDFLSVLKNEGLSAYLAYFNLHSSRGAIIISLISLVIMILMQQSFARKWKILPVALVVVLVSTFINFLFINFQESLHLRPTQLVSIPTDFITDINFPKLSKLFSSYEILKYGLIIGLLASLETLLCIEAIDKLDRHNRITPVNRELFAQGVGNIFCGFLGAIPITAVIVRGSANVDAGGRTKMSAFMHGVFLMLAVLFIPFLLNKIPYAALAAILIITGYNLTRPKLYRNMWALGWKQFLPFMITIIVILATDLLVGVSIGLLVSIYFIIQNNFRAEYRLEKTRNNNTDVFLLKLNSNVTFLNKVKLKKALDELPEYSVVTIDGTECNFIDYDILEIISEYKNKARDRHIELHLNGIQTVNLTSIH